MTKAIDPRDEKNYQDAPSDVEHALGSAVRIEDTLPPPEDLIRKSSP